jgi:hypothetical protein
LQAIYFNLILPSLCDLGAIIFARVPTLVANLEKCLPLSTSREVHLQCVGDGVKLYETVCAGTLCGYSRKCNTRGFEGFTR